MDDGFIDDLKAFVLIFLTAVAWFVCGGLFLECTLHEKYEHYENGFDDGINGSLEEYNYSAEYIKYFNKVHDHTDEEFMQAKYHEGFIDGYLETYNKKQFDKIKKEGGK